MRDPERIPKVMARLMALWLKNPDMRLGQLIVNVMRQTQGTTSAAVTYNIEDDQWVRMLDDVLKNGW